MTTKASNLCPSVMAEQVMKDLHVHLKRFRLTAKQVEFRSLFSLRESVTSWVSG